MYNTCILIIKISNMSNLEVNSQAVLEKLLLENLKENRRRRCWSNFFKTIFLLIILVIVVMMFMPGMKYAGKLGKPHTAVIDISGEIMPDSQNDANNVVSSLTKAFKNPYTKGIILRINSPGGSPVQASYIFNNVMRLRKQYPNIKVYGVCSDLCASAAYYIASSTNDIYADPSSLVGSIGVLLNGFGFVDTMQKLGISRRLLTAGSEKGFLDPFSPMKPEDKVYADKMLQIVHEQFIKAVEEGRGNRLDTKNPLIFSGLIWTGVQAKALGLIDGFGSAGYVAREIIKCPTTVNYTKKQGLFDRVSKGIGENFSIGVLSTFLGNKLS